MHSPCEDTRRAFAVGPPPQKSGSPEPDSCDRSHLSRTDNHSCQHVLPTELLVSPFVGVCVTEDDTAEETQTTSPHSSRAGTTDTCPGTTRSHSRVSTALPKHRSARRWLPPTPSRLLLRPHSPATAFESLGRPGRAPENHPGCHSGSCVSHLHRLTARVAIPLTGRDGCCWPARQSRPSFRCVRSRTSHRFRRVERRSTLLPISRHRSRFGTVFRQTDRQAITRLSWLSYSQPSDLPMVPVQVMHGLADCSAQCSPRRSG